MTDKSKSVALLRSHKSVTLTEKGAGFMAAMAELYVGGVVLLTSAGDKHLRRAVRQVKGLSMWLVESDPFLYDDMVREVLNPDKDDKLAPYNPATIWHMNMETWADKHDLSQVQVDTAIITSAPSRVMLDVLICYEALKPGCSLVALMPYEIIMGESDEDQMAFRRWLAEVKAEFELMDFDLYITDMNQYGICTVCVEKQA